MREPGHDSYWNFHRDLFFELVPPPGERRGGLELTMVSVRRPLQDYVNALSDAGFLIDRLREPRVPDEAVQLPRSRRWQRLPLFLHLRAVKR